MEESKREELKKMVNEYQGNCYWEAEGWGDNVPSEEDLEKELESILDYFDSEISKAREEVLLELLEKKTNYKIEKVGHGYKVTQEYVLVSDIEKELSKLTTK